DRVDRRPVRAPAHPLLALRIVPQRADQLPGSAVVARAEEAAGDGPAPKDAVFLWAPGLKRENVDQAVGDVLAPAVAVDEALWLFWKGRRGDFLPDAARPPMQLDAEVAVVEHSVVVAAARIVQRERDVVAEKIRRGDAPVAVLPLHREQSLAGRHHKPVAHSLGPRLSSRQGLQDIDGAAGGNGVAQMDAIAERPSVDDDRHVTPQRGLIVEHITAEPLVRTEDGFERLSNRRALHLSRGTVDVASKVSGENDAGHRQHLAHATRIESERASTSPAAGRPLAQLRSPEPRRAGGQPRYRLRSCRRDPCGSGPCPTCRWS